MRLVFVVWPSVAVGVWFAVVNDWKLELDAIVGARHGGRIVGLAGRLRDLETRHPGHPEIAAELAFALAAAGDDEGALAAYERALALGPANPAELGNLLVGRACCLLRLGRAEEAVAALERARVQFPGQAEFGAYLAVARLRAGRPEEAFCELLDVLLDGTEDVGLTAHQRTLRHLARTAG